MAGVVLGEDGERDSPAVVLQEGDLVVDGAGAASPAALEVEPPPPRPRLRDPPALRRDDAAKQVSGVTAVALGDVVVEPIHESRLIAGGRPAQPPDAAVEMEIAHPGVAREPLDRS